VLLVLISFGMFVDWHHSLIINGAGNKQMNYFFVTRIFGLGFSYICFFLTVWRKSSKLLDLVNYFKFTTNNNTFGDGQEVVRNYI